MDDKGFKWNINSPIDFGRSHLFDIKSFLLTLILTQGCLFTPLAFASGDLTKVDVRAIDGNFHIEFSGATEWDYDLERKDSFGKIMVELRVPSLSPQAQSLFEKLPTNNAVESIFLEKVTGGAKDILTITLKSNQVESFDYLTEKPSRLIIDFYLVNMNKNSLAESTKKTGSKGSTSLPAKVGKNRKPAADEFAVAKVTKNEKGEETAPSPTSVSPSNGALTPTPEPLSNSITMPMAGKNKDDEDGLVNKVMSGIFDGGDPQFERFNIKDHEIRPAAIIRSEENLYIPFPMREMDGVHYEDIKSRAPVYEITPKNTDENKMARLVLTLFEKNRLSVALKTIKWFFEKYPQSEYAEIVQYIKGDIYFKRWSQSFNRTDYDMALQAYREALMNFPGSLLSLRTQFLLGYSQFANKDFFGSLKTFQKVVKDQRPSEVRDQAHLAVARALLKINQFDEAILNYDDVQKNGFTEKYRNEAAYVKGDVYFSNKNYEKAIESYSYATKKITSVAQLYPSGFFNLAESYFWSKRYKEALDSYRDYLTRFPRDSHAPYAMTRVGEVLEILGADMQRSTGAFLETFFRYGGTSGAAVARMRLLSRRMAGMKEKEALKAKDEIQKISVDFPLPQIDLLASILVAEGLSSRGAYQEAIAQLLNWYQTNSSTRDVTLIKKRIVRHVNEQMAQDVERGEFFKVLDIHGRFADLWLRDSGRIDTIYNVGRAFEQSGSNKPALKLYLDAMNKLIDSETAPGGRNHSVFEHLPTQDQLNLRLARVNYELDDSTKALFYLKEIKKPLALNDEYQIERMELSVDLLKSKGDGGTAKVYLKDLIKNWQGQTSKVSGLRLRLAELELNEKSYDKAAATLEANRQSLEDSRKDPSPDHFKTLALMSDVYSEAKDNENNETILTELLKRYETAPSINGYRYRLGKLYFDQGKVQKAREIWAPLEKNNVKFWWDLANNNLKENSWNESYKKYLDRIPAMDGFEQKGKQ